jgi:Gpi18-like mannosyltransferase
MPHRAPKRPTRPAKEAGPASAGSSRFDRLHWPLVITSLALGIVARLIAVLIAPQTSYLPDHISNMGWSTYAYQQGPWRIYELPARQPLVARVQDPRTNRVGETVKLNAHACNYPPLSIYLFWLQGAVWHALDGNEVTLQPSPQVASRFGIRQPVTSRVVDTRASRFADALPALVFDLFLAWGVAALVRTLRPGRGRMLAAAAFAITILAPPIFLDSAFWNQADAWIACLLVWCLAFLMRERLILAGLIYGAALMTKPQAVLFAPVFVYVFLALRFAPGGTWRRALGLLKTAVVALVVVAVVAAPFMISDARSEANTDGAFRWFKRSYVGTIGSEMYQRTTLSAFNLWWLDLLAHGTPQQRGDVQRFLDAETAVFGLSKAVIGKVLLGLAIVLAWVLCARKWRWTLESWPVCAFVILLAAFVLPTSVHERYIYYCIPFAVALAACARKWIAPLVVLLVVGTLEMTSFRWASLAQIYAADSSAKGVSSLLAILTVLTLLYSYVVLIPKVRRAKPPE